MTAEPDLLLTKIAVPSRSAQNIARDRLLVRLDKAFSCKLTTVIAPAGYGKSTLVQEWAMRISDKPCFVAWLSLDAYDDSPLRYWSYLAAALRRGCAPLGNKLANFERNFDPESSQAMLNTLINAMANVDRPTVLVIDDFHVISHPAIHDEMAYLIEHSPDCLHVILLSRESIPLPQARLRSQRQLLELTSRDLAFTPLEASEFLNNIMGLHVDAGEAVLLTESTEGWIVGLQFAALTLEDGNGGGLPAREHASRKHQLLEYFTEEVLERLTPAMRDFLLQTSVIGTFSASLCDSVLGRTDSQAMLEEAERRRLFIESVGEGRSWYRYHALFAEALQTILARDNRKRANQVHLKACTWLYDNGYAEHAIPHAIAAGDYNLAAAVLCDWGVKAVGDFHLLELTEWIDELPRASIERNPRLGIYYALACFELGRFEQIEAKLQRVEDALTDAEASGVPLDDACSIAEESNAIRAAVACVEDEYRKGIDLARSAMGDSKTRNAIVTGVDQDLAYAYESAGDLEAAANAFDRVSRQSLELGYCPQFVRARCELARIRTNQGHLVAAEDAYASALRYVEEEGLGSEWLVCARSGLAELGIERGNPDAFGSWVHDAARFMESSGFKASSWVHAIPAYRRVIGCLLTLGDVDGALRLSDGLQGILRRCSRLSIQPFGEAMDALVRVWIEAGDFESAERFLVEARRKAYAPGALKMAGRIAIVRYHLAVGDFDSALGVAAELGPRLRSAKAVKLLIEALCLEAIAFERCGKRNDSIRLVREALGLGRQHGFLRMFAAQGEPLKPLLERLYTTMPAILATPSPQRYLSAVLEQFSSASSERGKGEMRDDGTADIASRCAQVAKERSLSDRQAQVLAMLAKGRNARYIQETLCISNHTAKSHILSVYRKLGVHSQQELISLIEGITVG